MALAAAHQALNLDEPVIQNLIIQEPIELTEAQDRIVQTVVSLPSDGPATLQIFSTNDSADEAWELHATAEISTSNEVTNPSLEDIEAIKRRCTDEISAAAHYQTLSERSLNFGASLQGVDAIWRREGEALGKIHAPDEIVQELEAYLIHPALLDACLQILSAATSAGNAEAYLPLSVGHFVLYKRLDREVWSHASIQRTSNPAADMLKGNIQLRSTDGKLVAEIKT